MAEVEVIQEIHVAQFWRKVLGDHAYSNYNPADLRRWYDALENRGPLEIREYLIERSGRYPEGQVTGIVATAPHPPREIVKLWLESHDKIKLGAIWLALPVALILIYEVATNLQGWANLPTYTSFQMKPPQVSQPLPQLSTALPSSPATQPQNLPAPAQNAARPTGTPTQQQQ